MTATEHQIELDLIAKFGELKDTYRPDIRDRTALERNFREEFNRFQEGCVEENTHTGTLVRRLLSNDYADKVIVTTIQKLGLAVDENSKRNKQRSKSGQKTYKEQLAPLSDKRIVLIPIRHGTTRRIFEGAGVAAVALI